MSDYRFELELGFIRDQAFRNEIARFLEDMVPTYFWKVPASSSGKYHPEYALGDGGLMRHTQAAVLIAEDLLSLEQNSALQHDVIIAALLLHDTFKHGIYGTGYTVHQHPIIAAEEVLKFSKTTSKDCAVLFEEVAMLISTHMGQWTTGRGGMILPKPITESQKFVHMCDYLASRKYLTVGGLPNAQT